MPHDFDDFDDEPEAFDDVDEDDRDASYFEHLWGGPDDEELEHWYQNQEEEDEGEDDGSEFGPGDFDSYAPALPTPQSGDEAASRQHFTAMKQKYRAESFRDTSPLSPLYRILVKLESNDQLHTADQSWLRKNRLKGPLRIYATRAALDFESRFRERGDPWDAAKASSFWRMAEQPSQALSVTVGLADGLGVGNSRVKAVILTTRGGAFRDLRQLTDAESLGQQAVKLNPQSFHPFMLLGAVYYQKGDPQEGDKYFANAIRLGAKPENQDWEIKKAIVQAGEDEQRVVAHYLLEKDPVKYRWARKYLQ
jgi:tetratricopeptide (TPR) repeat protein